MKRLIRAADLFCGAGGTSTGLRQACEKLGYSLELLAINHWDVAIATHSANHPDAEHLCTGIDAVDPRKAVPGGRLDLLWASPECQHFSVARGGKPVSDQNRASAWLVLRWAELLYIDTILIENVKEFVTWGPVGVNGRPLKSKRGDTFRAFVAALESLGYRVEWQILNAADYGAATTRERLFMQARRGRKAVSWPQPTHHRSGFAVRSGRHLAKWRAAREIIDWNIPGTSIFERKRPLAPATMTRIIAGLEKFGGKELEPFLVILRNHAGAASLDRPLPTLTAGGTHIGVAQPFITAFRGSHAGKSDGNQRNHSIEEPLRTMDTSPRFGLVEPFILPHRAFEKGHVDSIDAPLRTITTVGGMQTALVEPKPFIVPQSSEGAPRSVEQPTGGITTTSRGIGLAEPFLLQLTHGGRIHDIDQPVPTVTTARRGETGIVSPLIAKYYGTGQCRPVSEPLDTVTTKERFGLVTPLVVETKDGQLLGLDIHFRMLSPRELARAMEFPDSYQFTGNREAVVKQIGNAVVTKQAQALCEAVLA